MEGERERGIERWWREGKRERWRRWGNGREIWERERGKEGEREGEMGEGKREGGRWGGRDMGEGGRDPCISYTPVSRSSAHQS